MNEFGVLSADEVKLLRAFRDGERLVRARIMIAAASTIVDPTQEDIQLLEYFATYMDCNEHGRKRCVEASEIFASSGSTEEAYARLAEIEELRLRCEVIDMMTGRPT